MNHNKIIHYYIENYPVNLNHVLDMTAGNGHDTYFLADKVNLVSSIDLQEQALTQTKSRCKAFDNINYYQINHQDIASLQLENVDAALFNLGYLPQGDKSIITKKESTLIALDYLVSTVNYFISIACYIGHDGGLKEQEAIKNYLDEHQLAYHTIVYDKPLSPITYIVDLKDKRSSNLLIDDLRTLNQEQVLQILNQAFYAK